MKDILPQNKNEETVYNALTEFQDKLYALIRMLIVCKEQDAMDVLQKTNEAIIQHIGQHRPDREIWHWFRAIAVQQVNAYYREKRSEKLDFDSELVETMSSDIAQDQLFHGLPMERYLAALRGCLDKLPPMKRDLLRERYFSFEKVDDIAKRLGVTSYSLSMLFFRLRKALKGCIEKTLHGQQRRNLAEGKEQDGDPQFEGEVDRFLDGLGDQPWRNGFVRQLKDEPGKRIAFMEQAFLHALLECRRRDLLQEPDGIKRKPVFRVAAGIAAILSMILGGVFAWSRQGEKSIPPPQKVARALPREDKPLHAPTRVTEKTIAASVPAAPSKSVAKTTGRQTASVKAAPRPAAVEKEPVAWAKPSFSRRPTTSSTATVTVANNKTKKEPQKEMTGMNAKALVTNLMAVTTVLATNATTASALTDDDFPQISGVTMKQPFDTRDVTITYTLENSPAIITLSITTNGIALPDSAVTHLAGDVCKLIQPGTHAMVWKSRENWPDHKEENARAVVTAWSTNTPPQYCAVDMSGGKDADVYPVHYYLSADGVPGGVTNNAYKSELLLLRHVPATENSGFRMGSPISEFYRVRDEVSHRVILTDSIYAGVYEVTQYQWWLVMGDRPSYFQNNDCWMMRPVEMVRYAGIRGNDAGAGWPDSHAVDEDSFLGKLRKKAGIGGFDLPTEAQWEYAARAGAEGAFPDGTMNVTNGSSDANVALFSRYQRNGGFPPDNNYSNAPDKSVDTTLGTAVVGSYLPNNWGLYDTVGNAWEWCLDWYCTNSATTVTNPVGPQTGTYRVIRGSCFSRPASNSRIAMREKYVPNGNVRYGDGFRVFCSFGN